MILDSPTITIKQEPDALQEEQDDVVLSYLNSDYVTTDTMTSTESNDPPSPPYSTSSASTDAAPSLMDLDMDLSMDNNTSSLYTQDPFLLHLQTTLNQQGMPFSWPTATWPMGPIQGGADPCLLDLSTNPLSFLSPSPPLYQPGDQQQKQPEQHSKKKGGGRKKREVSIAPAPLTPILPATTPEHHVLKQETSVTPSLDNQQDERSPAEIAHAKRQERLIKNRAAALMSRKRKREHLTTLEEERQQLTNENQSLRSKVSSLEARVVSLEQENMELKRKLSSSSSSSIGHKQHQHHHISLATPKHAKTTGMVFMIILFSFALFTLPSSHSPDHLTVGGSGPVKPNIPLIGSSSSSVPEIRMDLVDNTDTTATITSTSLPDNTTTTDLMLIDHVQPDDLQTWIKETLNKQDHHETSLVQWHNGSTLPLYLYTNQFSRVIPSDTMTDTTERTLSILCPLNQTTSSCPSYLQIDVQVIGSRVLEGELKHMDRQEEQQKSGGDSAMMLGHGKDRRRNIHHLRKTTIEGASRFSRVIIE